MIVYALAQGIDLVSDGITFPVDALTNKGLEVHLQPEERSETLQITVKAPPGSRVTLTGTNWSTYSMQAGNDLTYSQVCMNSHF